MSTTTSDPKRKAVCESLFAGGCSQGVTRRKKGVYKHIPHREKPAGVVAKRNARERRRVQTVNQAFIRLGQALPHNNKVRIDLFILADKASNCDLYFSRNNETFNFFSVGNVSAKSEFSKGP